MREERKGNNTSNNKDVGEGLSFHRSSSTSQPDVDVRARRFVLPDSVIDGSFDPAEDLTYFQLLSELSTHRHWRARAPPNMLLFVNKDRSAGCSKQKSQKATCHRLDVM